MTKVLFISDIHFKHNNLVESNILIQKLRDLSDTYDFAVLAGDILDTHERIDCQLLNRAYELVNILRGKTHVYICIGNHDMINNQQFLTTNHWMNGMKEWYNVTIVDKPIRHDNFIFVPYVYPGRFVEALNKISNWKNAVCIFAHQEIKGCKMGAFISEEGDEWDLQYPQIISGHIHERQRPQSNVFYPGSVLTHAFGGNVEEDQGLCVFTFDDQANYTEHRISLGLTPKKTVHVKAGQCIKNKDLNSSTRIVIVGTTDQIAEHKKSRQYNIIQEKGAKIVYKIDNKTETVDKFKSRNFLNILEDLIKNLEDAEILKDYLLLTS